MKALIKNISAGLVTVPEFTLNTGEETTVEFTEKIRYYIAMGYIRMLDFMPEEAKGYTHSARPATGEESKKKAKAKK